MLKKNAKQNVEESCTNLREVQQFLSDASQTVESNGTRSRIQTQMSMLEQCLNECEDIANTLRQQ